MQRIKLRCPDCWAETYKLVTGTPEDDERARGEALLVHSPGTGHAAPEIVRREDVRREDVRPEVWAEVMGE